MVVLCATAAGEPINTTGDSEDAAQSIAKQVGIESDHVLSGALPQRKLTKIRELQSESHTVVMVGDGINDAAALVGADVSIAMGTGTDVAVASADITLMRKELVTTNKLDNAIAPAAYIGESIPRAAIGIPTTLYAKAHPRLTRIVLRVRLESLSASNTAAKSLRIKVPRTK